MIKKVIHIHGSLSYRDESHYTVEELFGVACYSGMQANSGRRDSEENLNELIRYQAKGIKIIGENDSTDAEIVRAIDAITKAARVIFLGFSYDERNLGLVGVKNWAQNKAKITYSGRELPSLMGSAYRLRRGQQETVKAEFWDNIDLGSSDLTCVPYCNEHVVLI